ncbi:hypothetical protein UFOVP558_6 [uncultured Caudovirales phage]|uniref:Uncharacterized protein n=1 Tax=uncultured Caudovirales phage TaxID=2100421 RepID=A0A6J5N0N6_9CAUD|nr:hypothetical protein UFOVP558_6 [uncultured Caudovirales phage]
MHESEDWIMRPVIEGMCLYESLIDGRLDLEDMARMNEALEVKSENEFRYRKANEK